MVSTIKTFVPKILSAEAEANEEHFAFPFIS